LTGLSQDSNPSLDITEIQRVLESRHCLSSLLSDDLHHSQLLGVSSDEVKERELVERLCFLVASLDDLAISARFYPALKRLD
jgi:hypothetical protein